MYKRQLLNTVIGELLVAVGSYTAVVQPVHQLLHGRTIVAMCIRDRSKAKERLRSSRSFVRYKFIFGCQHVF